MDHEEEYVFDEDAENDDHGAEDVDPIESAYYNAKGGIPGDSGANWYSW